MTRTDHIALTYQLEFDSAFHCGSGLARGLIHRAIVRDGAGYLHIPGSTIKGVLRENCEQIAQVCGLSVRDPHDETEALKLFSDSPNIVERIFGSRYQESPLFFDNAVMTDESKGFFDSPSQKQKYMFMQTETRTQTRVSRRTRTVKQGALYTSEFGAQFLLFKGKIHGCLTGISNELSELPGTYPLFLLIAGIRMTDRIGANRSTGMGRCSFSVQELQVNGTQENEPLKYCEDLESLVYYEIVREEQ